jgi:hypothetical protein
MENAEAIHVQPNSLTAMEPGQGMQILWVYRARDGHLRTGIRACQQEFFRKGATMTAIMKTPSFLGWYHILRAHDAFTFFQAVRYALWLAR